MFSNLVPKTKQRKISREYIDHLTEVALDDKVFDQHEAQLVSSALELDNKLVRDFMIENPICVQQHGTIHD